MGQGEPCDGPGVGQDESGPQTIATTGGEHSTSAATSAGNPIELAETVAGDGQAPPSESRPRARIGRYSILNKLGAGGMGVVWEATDPELARGVAIKVMRAGGGKLAERLRREAKALAKLHHPNVVAVYDVGIDDGELYIVMQLVAGTTLDHAVHGKSHREIVELLVDAGRGLEAAHAAGIVHRDFKPTNVLVDGNGNVRVTDFGLARASEASDEVVTVEGGTAETSMTRGELVGTPAYMAPEQFRAGPVTSATDQFAFCVTLWEMLAGERPYAGHDIPTLKEAVLGESRRDLPAKVSRRVRAALLRGLSTDPARRFASMTELLQELEPRRRTLWIAGGVGLVGLATTVALLGVVRTHEDPCNGIELPADAVWNGSQKAAVTAALGGAALPVTRYLDDRTARWKAGRRDACQATNVRSEQTPTLLQQRYLCLDRSLTDERAAITTLTAKLDRSLIAQAITVAAGGLDPEDCNRTRAPGNAPQVAIAPNELLYAELARAHAMYGAGRYNEVLAMEPSLTARVVATGDPTMTADWFYTVGSVRIGVSDLDGAREPLRKAAEAGLRAGNDTFVAHAQSALASSLATLGELKGIDELLASARDAAVRSANPDAPFWVDLAAARITLERGDNAGALKACREIRDRAERSGLHQFAEDAGGCMLDALLTLGDSAGAVATGTAILEERAQRLGEDHPSTLQAARSVAIATATVGDQVAAKRYWDRVFAGTERIYGAESIEMMETLRDFATSQSPGGVSSTPEAGLAMTRAVAIAEKILAPNNPLRAAIHEAHAYVEGALGHGEESVAAWRAAIAAYEKLDDPLGLARALYNAADRLKTAGRCDQAMPLFRRAAHLAQDSKAAAMEAATLGSIGACLGSTKQWAEAELALNAAIQQLDSLGMTAFAAQNRWELADQLVKRKQKAKGLAIAKAAADQLAGQPPPGPELQKQIVEWIAKQ